MSVPPKRRTSSQKKRRASHFALTKASFSHCAKCKLPALPHRLCANCGEYAKGPASASPSAKAMGDKKATAGK